MSPSRRRASATVCSSIRPRRSRTSGATACATSCARRSTWARAPSSSSAATARSRARRFGVDESAAAGVVLHAHRPSVLRRRRARGPACSTGYGPRSTARPVGRARHRLGVPRLRAHAVVGEGAGAAAPTSTRRSARRRRERSTPRPPCTRRSRRALDGTEPLAIRAAARGTRRRALRRRVPALLLDGRRRGRPRARAVPGAGHRRPPPRRSSPTRGTSP